MSRLRHASRPADRPLVAMPPQAGNPGSLPIRSRPKIDRSSTGPRPFHRDPDTAPRPSRPTPATARRRPPPSRPARRQPLLVLGAHAQRHAQAPLAVARRRVHRQHPVLCIRRAPCRQPTTSMPSMSAPVCPPRPLPHTCTSLTAPARRAQPDRPPRLRPNLVHRRRLAVDALAARPGAQLRPRRVGAHTHSTTPAADPAATRSLLLRPLRPTFSASPQPPSSRPPTARSDARPSASSPPVTRASRSRAADHAHQPPGRAELRLTVPLSAC